MTHATSEVLVLLDGDEGLRQCPECCAPAFAMLTAFYSTPTHYLMRTTIWCANGHERLVVSPPQPLDDDMKELLA
jgi:hypothetical protein